MTDPSSSDPSASGAPEIIAAAPLVPVGDVAASVDFYTGVLGFALAVRTEEPGFAIVERGGAALHLIDTGDAEALRATATQIAVYLWVRGLDALWRSLEPALGTLPDERVRVPFDQPYGVREFHVKDPDGCLLFFAERG